MAQIQSGAWGSKGRMIGVDRWTEGRAEDDLEKRRYIQRKHGSRGRDWFGFRRGRELAEDAAETRVFLFTIVRRLRGMVGRRDKTFQRPR